MIHLRDVFWLYVESSFIGSYGLVQPEDMSHLPESDDIFGNIERIPQAHIIQQPLIQSWMLYMHRAPWVLETAVAIALQHEITIWLVCNFSQSFISLHIFSLHFHLVRKE